MKGKKILQKKEKMPVASIFLFHTIFSKDVNPWAISTRD